MRQSQTIITTILSCEFIAGAKKMRIAFIGLGVLGCRMASILAGVGHEATVDGRAVQFGIIHVSRRNLIQQLNRASIYVATTKRPS